MRSRYVRFGKILDIEEINMLLEGSIFMEGKIKMGGARLY